MWSQAELSTKPLQHGAPERTEQVPKNLCRTQIGFGRFISSGLVPALLGLDWINWDACALQLRDNCITEIYLLLKVSPPLSSIRTRSYAESRRICRKVGMAGSTHGLCMSLCAVPVFLFSSVAPSAVACSGGPLPVTLCRVCNVGRTIPPVGRGAWCLLVTIWLII